MIINIFIYKNRTDLFIIIMILLMLQSSTLAQSGSIQGVVKDKNTGEALTGANIFIKGSNLGAATDLNGKFTLLNIPEGKKTLVISYIGYKTISAEVTIYKNETLEENFSLEAKTLEGETVYITAQASGQLSAINQQLSSNNLVNIVSSEKMQKLPDANIAESIGRLPGISLVRNQGEAYAVTIRGLSPKYNEVTIEGVPMSSTNYRNREIDLSLLSDDLIKGVEVSKTLKPDMDADALGGTINLTLRTAQPGLHYYFRGNNNYKQLRDSYNNFNFSGNISDRFLDNKIGILAQGNFEKSQPASDQFNAGYDAPVYDSKIQQFSVSTQYAQLTETNIKRLRFGLNFILDYASKLVDVKFYNIFDQKIDTNLIAERNSNFSSNEFDDQVFYNETTTKQETHSLQAVFKIGNTELPVSLSYTKGDKNTPNGNEFYFEQLGVSTFTNNQRIYQTPSDLIKKMGVLDPNSISTTLPEFWKTNTSLTDESYDAKLDWKIPFNLSDSFSGNLSVGGKYHSVNRKSNFTAEIFGIGNQINRDAIIDAFSYLAGLNRNLQTGIPAYPFADKNNTRKNILGYPIDPGWNIYRLVDMQKSFYPSHVGLYSFRSSRSYNQNYTDKENTNAGYVMGEINIGNDFTSVAGVRYQEEITDISAYHIRLGSNQDGLDGTQPKLVEDKRDFPSWYPSVNVKYKASGNIQILGAIYKSVSLPSYSDISPLVVLGGNNYLIGGNPVLKPSTAWNFDLGASLFSNEIGLFTVNFFYKEISNLIYDMQNYYLYDPYPIINAPSDIYDRFPDKSYYDTTWAVNQSRRLSKGPIPMNDPEKAYLRGVELSWQTHLWYLPGFLSGIVLDLNLSLMSSNQLYPSFELKPKIGFLTPDTLVYQTTSGSLQDQPSAIYNAIIGWDYKGFSSRFSFRYQQKTLTSVDTRFGLEDSYYDNVLLIDISLKQKIIAGLAVYASANNINNHVDNYYYSHPAYVSTVGTTTTNYPAGNLPTSGQTYGLSLQFGVSYTY